MYPPLHIHRLFYLVLLLFLPPAAAKDDPPQQRQFRFTYAAEINQLQPGQTARIWLPVPTPGPDQQVELVRTSLPAEPAIAEEPEYGNRIMYVEAAADDNGRVNLEIVYRIKRLEIRSPLPPEPADAHRIRRFLAPDQLVPIGGMPVTLIDGHPLPHDQLKRARLVYDRVFNHMTYSKHGSGWGLGDAEWACESGYGNCTDFHSLFISITRTLDIPARFEMGFAVPQHEDGRGAIGGYHCWAFFKPGDVGWVPVDISEARQHEELRDYYFGNLTADRVRFTIGRDITLVPRQDGPPLNFFIYPYVEVNGRPYPAEHIRHSFSYEDVSPHRQK